MASRRRARKRRPTCEQRGRGEGHRTVSAPRERELPGRAERASARSGNGAACGSMAWGLAPRMNRPHTAGLGDHVVVLAGCLGCRSRRAALGPGRKTMGLASGSPYGRLSRQSSAESRIAVAKATSTRAASNETGDRLPVIPYAYGESPKRKGEGELVDGRRSDPARSSSLTSRRRRWIQRPHAKGIRSRDQVRGGS